jgi:hypothetical protein
MDDNCTRQAKSVPFISNPILSFFIPNSTIKYNGKKYLETGLEGVTVPTQCKFIQKSSTKNKDEFKVTVERNGDVASTFSVFGYDIRKITVTCMGVVLHEKEYPMETHKVIDFDCGKYGMLLINKMYHDYHINIIAGSFEGVVVSYLHLDTDERRLLAQMDCSKLDMENIIHVDNSVK